MPNSISGAHFRYGFKQNEIISLAITRCIQKQCLTGKARKYYAVVFWLHKDCLYESTTGCQIWLFTPSRVIILLTHYDEIIVCVSLHTDKIHFIFTCSHHWPCATQLCVIVIIIAGGCLKHTNTLSLCYSSIWKEEGRESILPGLDKLYTQDNAHSNICQLPSPSLIHFRQMDSPGPIASAGTLHSREIHQQQFQE